MFRCFDVDFILKERKVKELETFVKGRNKKIYAKTKKGQRFLIRTKTQIKEVILLYFRWKRF